MRKEKEVLMMTTSSSNNQDEPRYTVTYTPTKKGGDFGLPLGALLTIPAGNFGKKDTVTCHVVSPSERWRNCPKLPATEHLISEIYTLTASVQPKKPAILQMPFYDIDLEFNELNVKGKWSEDADWVDVGFLMKECTKKSQARVELELDRLGTFVVTVTPKKETFDITAQGCLYNARISRYVSVRFPKKAVDSNMSCYIQVHQIPAEKIALVKEQCPFQCGDLERISEFIDIMSESPRTFRRAASIKLPLPQGVNSEVEDTADIAVLQKIGESWNVVDTSYRFTKTTVTFDVKQLSRFCVVQSKPDRVKRIVETVTVLEERANKIKGDILLFLSKEPKSWVLLIDCVTEDKVEQLVGVRKEKGFSLIKKEEPSNPEPEVTKFSRRATSKPTKRKEPESLTISDGSEWKIQLTDDLRFGVESDMAENADVVYYEYLPESYRRFAIEPKTNEEKTLIGFLSVIPVGVKESSPVMFKLEIPEEDVKEYFKPDYVPPPETDSRTPEPLGIPIAEEVKVHRSNEPVVPKFKPLPQDVMDRLTRSNKKPVILEKESRVLTGKSLMALSKVVQEGLTLAVHLDLPDSTITGIGFDALSNGQGMVDVTYKILLHWKRHLKDRKDGAVQQLCLALRDMGRQGAAMVVLEKHRDNKELSSDCFLIPSL